MFGDYQTQLKVKQQQVEEYIQEQAQMRLIRQSRQAKKRKSLVLVAVGRWMAESGQRIQARYGEEVFPIPLTGSKLPDC